MGVAFWAAWCASAGLLSAAATLGVIRIAQAYGVMDIPNARSSHHRPTPRGGGLAIVLVGLAGVTALAVAGLPPPAHGVWILVGALVVASISIIDDVSTISAKLRLAVHVVAAAIAVAAIGPIRDIDFGPLGSYGLGGFGVPVTIVWIVGMTNAFNFMDGIDGIAGMTAAVALTVLAAGLMLSAQIFAALVAGSLAAAAAGFLMWNWHPARIFMGDVGSAFLGYTIAVLPLLMSDASGARLVRLAAFVMWPFVFDTMYTLARRAAKRQNVFEAHRTHLYQRLVIAGWSHQMVALLYGGLSSVAGGAALVALAVRGHSLDAMLLIATAALMLGAMVLVALVHVSEAKAICRVSP